MMVTTHDDSVDFMAASTADSDGSKVANDMRGYDVGDCHT